MPGISPTQVIAARAENGKKLDLNKFYPEHCFLIKASPVV
jgi:hypothetical protein